MCVGAADGGAPQRFRQTRSGKATGATWTISCMGDEIGVRGAPVHSTAVRVDQVIPSLASRDAIGVHTLHLRDGLRAVGIDSDIYYGSYTPDVQGEGRPVIELGRSARDRWLLYQASIGSPVFDILAARAEPKLVNYHNITPAALLRDWEPAVAYEVALGRTQLARLAPQSRFAVADSAFNESELQALGYEGTAVVPLLIDMHSKSDEPDPELARVAGAPQGTRRGRRPALRRQDLAAQGAARSGQDARRPAPRPGPRRPPAPRGLAPRGDLRAGAARRSSTSSAWPTPCISPARSAAPSSRRTSGRPTSSSWPRTTRASACRWPRPWATACRSSPTASPRCPRPSAAPGWCSPTSLRVPFAAAVGRVLRDQTLREVLAAAGRERAAGFDLAASTRRFVSLVQEAVGA